MFFIFILNQRFVKQTYSWLILNLIWQQFIYYSTIIIWYLVWEIKFNLLFDWAVQDSGSLFFPFFLFFEALYFEGDVSSSSSSLLWLLVCVELNSCTIGAVKSRVKRGVMEHSSTTIFVVELVSLPEPKGWGYNHGNFLFGARRACIWY